METGIPEKQLTATIGRDSLVTALEVRAHSFTCDETPEYGGNDTAPDPYDYIMAALASCTAITLRMYADRRDLPLEKAEVTIGFQRCPAPEPEGKPDLLTRTIKLFGDLTDEQRERFKRVINCPAHKSISTGIPISTEFEG